jgi:hypothetical protein
MNQWGGNEPVEGGNEPVGVVMNQWGVVMNQWGVVMNQWGVVDVGGRRKPFLGLSVQFALLYKSPLLELILSGS